MHQILILYSFAGNGMRSIIDGVLPMCEILLFLSPGIQFLKFLVPGSDSEAEC